MNSWMMLFITWVRYYIGKKKKKKKIDWNILGKERLGYTVDQTKLDSWNLAEYETMVLLGQKSVGRLHNF
jgi:hypothetical protein